MTKYKKHLFKSISLFTLIMLVSATTSSTTYAASQTVVDSKVSNSKVTSTPNTENLGIWTKKTDLPTTLGGHSSLVLDGKIYVFGGSEDLSKSKYSSSVYTYDPTTDNWVKKTTMPKTLTAHSSVVLNGRIYIIGGYSEHGATSSVYSYDPNTNTWTQKADMPQALLGHTSVVFNNKIYVIGGYNGKNDVSSVYSYDPNTNTWTSKANDLESSGSPSSVVFDNKIYVFGGSFTSSGSSIRVYDPNTNTWTKKDQKIAEQTSSTNAVVLNDKIYILGGSLSPYVTEYDPNANTLVRKCNMLSNRSNHSSVVFNNKIYTLGGSSGKKFISDVDIYDVNSKDITTYLQLNKKVLDIEVGKSETLMATILPENVDNKKIEWSSSDKTIATVDENGLVTSVKEGTTTITATSDNGKLTASCTVNVQSSAKSSISLNKTTLNLEVGQSEKLLSKISPENVDNKKVIWSSSDKTIASVDENGLVTSLGEGSVIITVTSQDGKLTANCKVNIKPVTEYLGEWTKKTDMPKALGKHSAVTLDGKIYVLGGNENLSKSKYSSSVYVYDSNADAWTKKTDMPKAITAHSSVTSDGKIYVLGGYSDYAPSNSVYEYNANANSWTKKADMPKALLAHSSVIFDGKIYVIGGHDGKNPNSFVYVYDMSKNTWTTKASSALANAWNSSTVVFGNKIYVFGGVDSNNLIRVYDPSTDTWIKKDVKLLSQPYPNSAVVLYDKIYILGNSLTGLDLTAYDPNMDTFTKKADMLSPSCNHTSVVLNNKIYALGGGNGKEFSSTVEAYDTIGKIIPTSLQLNKKDLDLEVGKSENLIANILPENASSEKVSWSSSDETIATVDKNGLVVSLKEGTAIITVTSQSGNLKDSCTVNVKTSDKNNLWLDKTNIELEAGQWCSIDTNKHQDFNWVSSDPSIAKLTYGDNSFNSITALKEGTATITVTSKDGKLKGTCNITVKPTSKTGISLDKTSLDIEVGEEAIISGTILPKDDEYALLSWSSSDSNIVHVAEDGKCYLRGESVGTAIITATSIDGKFKATCTVNVKSPNKSNISLDKTSVDLQAGECVELVATVLDSNCGDLEWSSSDESIASLYYTGAKALIDTSKPGTATITVSSKDGKLKASCVINVKPISKNNE